MPPRQELDHCDRGVRGLSEPLAHQTGEVIVRRLLWHLTREQFLQLDPQDLHEVRELEIQNELQAHLDFWKPRYAKCPSRRTAISQRTLIATTAERSAVASLQAR